MRECGVVVAAVPWIVATIWQIWTLFHGKSSENNGLSSFKFRPYKMLSSFWFKCWVGRNLVPFPKLFVDTFYTVSGNRASIATVYVKPDCTGNVAIQIVAGQVVCTGSERSRD